MEKQTWGDSFLFYFIVMAVFSYVLYVIYIFVKRKVLFPLKLAYLWIVFKRTIQIGMWLILFYILGAVKPWLYEENISNLESVNGTLVVRLEGKNDRHYIRYLNGKETEFNFSLANLLRNINLRSYDGKAVVLWHKNRYVYQMETVEGEIVFSVDSANRAVCANNQIQALLYILLFAGWLLGILRSISERNGEMDENR